MLIINFKLIYEIPNYIYIHSQVEKAMAPHSTTLAWRIPGTGEPGGLLSMGSHRVGHDWSDLAAVWNSDHYNPQNGNDCCIYGECD